MTNLYEHWCHDDRIVNKSKTLWRLSELEYGREHVMEELPGRILNHYISDDEVAEFMETLGYLAAAKCIRELLPEAVTGRSGDLGEILATEFVDERLGYEVPVRRLRHKDHRDMSMRGEDVIGVANDGNDELKLLKGEAKSAKVLQRTTIEEARTKLEDDHGRPSAFSLIFTARKLIMSDDSDRKGLGKKILREASQRSIPKGRLAHLLFTLSGNQVDRIIQKDLHATDDAREHHSVNLRIPDHSDFIKAIYDGAYMEAGSIGDG